MRSVTLFAALSFCLLSALPAYSEEDLQVAKVYRDYPGYINPAVCENPNVDKAAAKQPEAAPAVVPPAAAAPAAMAAPPAPAPSPAMPAQAPAGTGPTAAPPANEVPPVKAAPVTPVVQEAPMPAPAVTERAQPAPAAETCWAATQADNPVGVPYLGVWAGMVATQDADIDAAVDTEATFDNGYGLGVAVGFDFGPARLEIEAAHRKSDVDKMTVGASKVDADGELEVQTLMLNGYADFQTGGNLTPYLGAGIGYAQVEMDKEDDSVLAGQVMAGVLFAVSPQVAIDFGYRFMMTDDPKLDGDEVEVRQHTVSIGLQFRF